LRLLPLTIRQLSLISLSSLYYLLGDTIHTLLRLTLCGLLSLLIALGLCRSNHGIVHSC